MDTRKSFNDVLKTKVARGAAREPRAFMRRGAGVRWAQALLAPGGWQHPAAALGDGHP